MKKKRWNSLICVLLILCLLGGCAKPPQGEETLPPTVTPAKAHKLAEAVYPTTHRYPDAENITDWEKDWTPRYEEWEKDRDAARTAARSMGNLEPFIQKTMEEFLVGEGNRIYSPLNVYMALAMVAETAGGNSRQQILKLLGVSDIEQLRREASALWNAHYRDDGVVTDILAGSFWLNEQVEVHQETLDRLAETYYASSYEGTPGTAEFNEALRKWLNEQTGGLLEEQIGKIEMNPEMVLTLATTIYFRAMWEHPFLESNTKEKVFHAPDGEVTCDFMHQSARNVYYWGEQFSAVNLPLEESGKMWLILPDEGVEVSALLKDQQVNHMINSRDYENAKNLIVNLALPKFDVVSEIELMDGLKNLGVTDIFDFNKSDFSPLCDETIAVTDAIHDARVLLDEEGCTATAITVMQECGSAMPPKEEVDFIVDRPFLFVITSEWNTPLFIGAVANP